VTPRTSEIDFTPVIAAAGGKFRAMMTVALWETLRAAAPAAGWEMPFALKVREVCRGRPALGNNGLPAYTLLPAGGRTFIFTTPGAHARIVITVAVDTETSVTMLDLGTEEDLAAIKADKLDWIEEMLTSLEADGMIRRVGKRNGQILWRVVESS
jgi:hypothetical protein